MVRCTVKQCYLIQQFLFESPHNEGLLVALPSIPYHLTPPYCATLPGVPSIELGAAGRCHPRVYGGGQQQECRDLLLPPPGHHYCQPVYTCTHSTARTGISWLSAAVQYSPPPGTTNINTKQLSSDFSITHHSQSYKIKIDPH